MNSAPPRVSVLASFGAGWGFLFRRFHRLALRLWAPVALLYLLQIGGLTPQAQATNPSANEISVLLAFLAHLGVTVLIIASAYRVALGDSHRFFLARLEIGPDEARLMGAKLLIWTALQLLSLGSIYLAQMILQVLAIAGFTIANILSIPPNEFQWFQDLTVAEPYIRGVTAVLFGLILVWLGLRFALVFAAMTAERRFALFDGMSLSKRNTWRLGLLWVLLWFSLMVVMKGPLLLVGAVGLDTSKPPAQIGADLAVLATTFDLGPPLVFEARSGGDIPLPGGQAAPVFNHGKALPPSEFAVNLPAWLAPVVTVFGNVLWQIVFAGALAHAYRTVAQSTAQRRLG